jgi:GNAT superfamily N-acetyltransferase
MAVALRPATPHDREFLLSVYAGTRADEMAMVQWAEAQKAAFVSMQFEAQDAAYRSTYPDGRFQIVTMETTPVGRLYLARLPGEIRVIDLTLLPDHRGTGIGSTLLSGIIAESHVAGLPIRLHVEHRNRARRLYERFGFITIAVDDVYEMMERPPSAAGTVS